MPFASLAAALLLLFQTSVIGTIDGAVVNSATGAPIAGAQVTLMPVPEAALTPGSGGIVGGMLTGVLGGVMRTTDGSTTSSPAAARPGILSRPSPLMVTTGPDGRFSFRDLNSGAYQVTVVANGYAPQEHGQRVAYGQGTPIYLKDGNGLTGVTIRLTPSGIVSGRILDESGEPAVDAPVQLLRAAYNPQGKTFYPAGSATANDRGEYRLYGITPGSYYLNAGNTPGPRGPGFARNMNQPAVTYTLTFHPGVTDLSQAAMIEVKSGAEVIADLRVARQGIYRVTGRIIDSRTGQPPAMAGVSLNYRNLGGGSGGFSSGSGYDPATGTFELQNVIPGHYTVQARIQGRDQFARVPDAAVLAARQAADAAMPMAHVPIHVTNADIEGLLLTLSVGASVPGRLTVEGAAPAPPSLDRIRLVFRPWLDGAPYPAGPAPAVWQIAADGTFRVDNLRSGEYSSSLIGVPPGFYVKGARLDGMDILGGAFKFSESSPGTIEIVLSAGAAQLDGSVTDTRNQPVAGIQAILVPAQRNRIDLYRTAVTDQNGRFIMTGITPGEYKLFSWEAIEMFRYLDPDFIKGFEPAGRPVRIAESSTQTIDVKIIPAGR